LHLRSSPEWVVRCWGGLLPVFWCWCVPFFCLVSRVEFLWLLSCGWFVALSSLVGRCCCTVFTVRGWLFLLYQFSFAVLIFECIIVSCVIFRVTVMCRHTSVIRKITRDPQRRRTNRQHKKPNKYRRQKPLT